MVASKGVARANLARKSLWLNELRFYGSRVIILRILLLVREPRY